MAEEKKASPDKGEVVRTNDIDQVKRVFPHVYAGMPGTISVVDNFVHKTPQVPLYMGMKMAATTLVQIHDNKTDDIPLDITNKVLTFLVTKGKEDTDPDNVELLIDESDPEETPFSQHIQYLNCVFLALCVPTYVKIIQVMNVIVIKFLDSIEGMLLHNNNSVYEILFDKGFAVCATLNEVRINVLEKTPYGSDLYELVITLRKQFVQMQELQSKCATFYDAVFVMVNYLTLITDGPKEDYANKMRVINLLQCLQMIIDDKTDLDLDELILMFKVHFVDYKTCVLLINNQEKLEKYLTDKVDTNDFNAIKGDLLELKTNFDKGGAREGDCNIRYKTMRKLIEKLAEISSTLNPDNSEISHLLKIIEDVESSNPVENTAGASELAFKVVEADNATIGWVDWGKSFFGFGPKEAEGAEGVMVPFDESKSAIDTIAPYVAEAKSAIGTIAPYVAEAKKKMVEAAPVVREYAKWGARGALQFGTNLGVTVVGYTVGAVVGGIREFGPGLMLGSLVAVKDLALAAASGYNMVRADPTAVEAYKATVTANQQRMNAQTPQQQLFAQMFAQLQANPREFQRIFAPFLRQHKQSSVSPGGFDRDFQEIDSVKPLVQKHIPDENQAAILNMGRMLLNNDPESAALQQAVQRTNQLITNRAPDSVKAAADPMDALCDAFKVNEKYCL